MLLHLLKYKESEQSLCQLDIKNINRFVNIFKLEEYYRLEADNYIPTLVSKKIFVRLLCYIREKETKLRR